jgi:hypothetical protein
MIAQQWLNVAGLGLDFIGVVLLAFEWWTALKADAREAEIDDLERRIAPNPMMPRPSGAHQAVFDHMNAQQKAIARSRRAAGTRGMRRGWFALAMVLIAAGFLLQMAGSWPGCCAWAGVMPGGG